MHCVTESGKVIERCSPDCPLRRQIAEQEKTILESLPGTYSELFHLIDPADHLMVMLCHLEYYGCIIRLKSGSYRSLGVSPPEMECPFRLFEFN